jgi:hypothetical protein
VRECNHRSWRFRVRSVLIVTTLAHLGPVEADALGVAGNSTAFFAPFRTSAGSLRNSVQNDRDARWKESLARLGDVRLPQINRFDRSALRDRRV